MPRKQRPILFQTEMVQSILEDRKTMTRRLTWLQEINEQPNQWHLAKTGVMKFEANGKQKAKQSFAAQFVQDETHVRIILCPYGNVGDLLWVRETWAPLGDYPHCNYSFMYKATVEGKYSQWKPSIHMPKEAARIILEITEIRIERLNDISEEDAIAEGVLQFEDGTFKNYFTQKGLRVEDGVECLLAKGSFKSLIASINGKNIIDLNPWVWVIKFKVLSKNGYPFNGNGDVIDSVERLVKTGEELAHIELLDSFAFKNKTT